MNFQPDGARLPLQFAHFALAPLDEFHPAAGLALRQIGVKSFRQIHNGRFDPQAVERLQRSLAGQKMIKIPTTQTARAEKSPHIPIKVLWRDEGLIIAKPEPLANGCISPFKREEDHGFAAFDADSQARLWNDPRDGEEILRRKKRARQLVVVLQDASPLLLQLRREVVC